jgi:hypothetical protein
VKKIIALKGRHNSGKSHSIRNAFDQLCRAHRHSVVILQSGPVLIKAIITIEDIKVGILSTGDVSDTLLRELKELRGFGCDVVVCACSASERKTTATEDMVIQFAREHRCSVAWIIKAYEEALEARDAANAATGAEIVAAVQSACEL